MQMQYFVEDNESEELEVLHFCWNKKYYSTFELETVLIDFSPV